MASFNIFVGILLFPSFRSTDIFPFPTGFIVAKSFVYVSLSNGRLLKVNIEDGKTKDIIKIDGDKISRPYILNKNMYILRNDAIVKVE